MNKYDQEWFCDINSMQDEWSFIDTIAPPNNNNNNNNNNNLIAVTFYMFCVLCLLGNNKIDNGKNN